MLWLCLRLPQLPLEALGLPIDDRPSAIVAQGEVILANTSANQRGIRAGISIQTARSLCGDLHCLPRNPDREEALLRQVALWSYRFSGSVSLCPPNAVLLELAASLRLFRSLTRLYRRFITAFRYRQLTVYTAIADTPLAAELLSLHNPPLKSLVDGRGNLQRPALQQALNALPIAALSLTPAQVDTLRHMGLHKLGQLQDLPLTALNRRLGPAMGALLQKLRGEQPDPRPLFIPAGEFHCQRQFDGGLEQHEQLRFPIAAMLGELKTYLQCRQCLPRELQWKMDYLDGGGQSWSMPLSLQRFDKRSVLELVMLGLEKRQLSGPVEQLSLYCRHFLPQENLASGLFDEAHVQRREQLDQVLAKLQLRLDADAISQFRLENAHLPEQSWSLTPARAKNLATTADLPVNIAREVLRPNWLVSPPQPLYQREGALHWRGRLRLLQGPERLDNQWWQHRQARDYYIARHEDGRLCWLYRDCLTGSWYLQGFFG